MKTIHSSGVCALLNRKAILAAAFLSTPAFGHVFLMAPTGDDELTIGSTYEITWQITVSHDTQNWDLHYATVSQEGPWNPIAIDLPVGDNSQLSIHTYDWIIPNDPSDTVWVRVTMDNNGGNYDDTNDLPCTIVGATPVTWTVDDDGKADFDTIQAAIDAASDGDEIVVMPGTYTDAGNPQVISIDGKDIWLHSSDGPEATFFDGNAMPLHRGILGIDSISTIEGFTIRNCVNDSEYGAGLRWENGELTLTNCIFTNNVYAADSGFAFGGGAYFKNSSVWIDACQFHGNSAETGSDGNGGHGGGLFLINCNATISDTVFSENTARHVKAVYANSGGGGISFQYGVGSLTNCTFINNYSDGWCGGVSAHASELLLEDCSFINNAGVMGGGFYLQNQGTYSSVATFNNCTFEDNHVSGWWGGDEITGYNSRGAGVLINYGAQSYLNNCDFLNNNAPDGFGGGVVCWSQVKFGGFEVGLAASQCTFMNNASSSGGAFWTDYVPVRGTSSGITPIVQYFDRPSDEDIEIVDRGGLPLEILIADSEFECNLPDHIEGVYTDGGGNIFVDDCPSACPDITGDGDVNVSDLLAVIDQWGSSGPSADVNGDGIVNITDLLEIVGNWGPCV